MQLVKRSAPTQKLDQLLGFGRVDTVLLAMLLHVDFAWARPFDLSILHVLHCAFLLMKKRCRGTYGS
jgi:hypothetical protein